MARENHPNDPAVNRELMEAGRHAGQLNVARLLLRALATGLGLLTAWLLIDHIPAAFREFGPGLYGPICSAALTPGKTRGPR